MVTSEQEKQIYQEALKHATGLVEKMTRAEPGRNVVFVAIENIREPGEIKQFLDDYLQLQRSLVVMTGGMKGMENADNYQQVLTSKAETIARSNVDYIARYYPEESRTRWLEALAKWSC